MNSQSQRGLGVADWLVTTAKSNPEGLLLVAAGAALLVRGSTPAYFDRKPGRTTRVQDEGEWPREGQTSRMVDDARQYAANMGGRASETASAYAASASRYAAEATSGLTERSGEFYDQASSTVQDAFEGVLRERPLMVALAGLAAGVALAAAFPKTDVERRTLGPYGERMTDFASEKAEQVKNAGVAAGERLMSEAEQRGLSPGGLKEMTQEAARAFSGALSPNESGSGPQSGAGPKPGAGLPQSRRTEEMEHFE